MTHRQSTEKKLDRHHPLNVGHMYDYLPEIIRIIGAQVKVGIDEYEEVGWDEERDQELYNHLREIEDNMKKALTHIEEYHAIVYESH